MQQRIRKLGIIQPGKIGDIIICLPIAKYYFDKGYEIVWPVDKKIINNFVDYIDYVKFIPIDFHCSLARKICLEQEWCNHIVDLSFNLLGSWEGRNSKLFASCFKEQTMMFDELKYQIADVPFEERWKLSFVRNFEREKTLFEKLNPKNEEFILTHWQGSDCTRKIEIKEQIKQIEAGPFTESIFDWLGVLEKAKGFVVIASCFSVLIEQMKFKQPKILLNRGGGLPVYKQDWNIIQ